MGLFMQVTSWIFTKAEIKVENSLNYLLVNLIVTIIHLIHVNLNNIIIKKRLFKKTMGLLSECFFFFFLQISVMYSLEDSGILIFSLYSVCCHTLEVHKVYKVYKVHFVGASYR